jgi:hypothetical protein
LINLNKLVNINKHSITTMTAPGDAEDRKLYRCIAYSFNLPLALRDGHDHDRMVVGFTTTYAISNMSSNPIHGKEPAPPPPQTCWVF